MENGSTAIKIQVRKSSVRTWAWKSKSRMILPFIQGESMLPALHPDEDTNKVLHFKVT